MPAEDDNNRIEELKKSLYSRTAPDVRTRRKLRFTDKGSGEDVRTDWEHPKEDERIDPVLNDHYEDHSMSILTKIFIGSALFCLIAVGIGAYLFFNGSNLISANNIDIAINGPVSIAGGSPVSFSIAVTNKNDVDLQAVDMEVDYPAGATDPSDPTRALTAVHQLLGDIPAGGSATQSESAIIFGQANMQKEIDVTVTYSVKGSSAVFTKTQTYDVLIDSSPIGVTVSSVDQITSGQEFSMKVDMKSNSTQTLKSVLLKAEYPPGYTFLSSDLKPLSSDNATWAIGDIPPGADRTVTIQGKLEGEDTDIRAFHFDVGAQDPSNPSSIATDYMDVEQDLTINKPFISLALSVGGDSGTADHVAQFGQPQQVTLSYFNNLDVAVSNVSIAVALSGSAYSASAVEPSQGYFQSGSNQITWNQQTTPALASVPAGGSGTISFAVIPTDLSTPSSPVIDPSLTMSASISGDRTEESGVSGTLTAAAARTIDVSPVTALSGQVVRTVGPFSNTGPIPPVSQQPTTYTVVWTVDNTSSTASDAQVTATLPAYVTWVGAVSPSSDDVTYDQNSGTVTWNIGSLPTYTVSSSRSQQVDFQISYTPSVSQVGQIPILVNAATLTATDDFTSTPLQSVQGALTTRDSTDPSYKQGDETVVK